MGKEVVNGLMKGDSVNKQIVPKYEDSETVNHLRIFLINK